MARPCNLTPEIAERLATVVRDTGCSVGDAAGSTGVGRRTVYRWLAKGKAQVRGRFRAFREAVQAAKSDRLVSALRIVAEAGPKDWKAAAWLAERLDPRHWSLRVIQHRVEDMEELLERLKLGLPESAYALALRLVVGEEASPDGFRERAERDGVERDSRLGLVSPDEEEDLETAGNHVRGRRPR